MLPVAAPLHNASVATAVVVSVGPGTTTTSMESVVQPFISVAITLCGPALTLVNVCGAGPVTSGVPSIEKRKGAAPAGSIVTAPLLAPLQLVGVLVTLAVIVDLLTVMVSLLTSNVPGLSQAAKVVLIIYCVESN